jgi:hypothetical protein
MLIPMYAFLLGLLIGLYALAVQEWRALRASLLIAAACLCFVVGVFGFGLLVFHASRLIVQRAIQAHVLRLEDYQRTHGNYPARLSEVGLQEPSFASARAVYYRAEDGSFGFVIPDPGLPNQTYVWNSRTQVWRDHYEQ